MSNKIDLSLHEQQTIAFNTEATELLYGGSAGGGKAEYIHNEILTTKGWRQMGNLKVGDQVFDIRGDPCNIVAATKVMYDRECYEVEFDNGEKTICDGGHQWLTFTDKDRGELLKLTPEFRKKRRLHRESRSKGKRPGLASMNSEREYEVKTPPSMTATLTKDIYETQTVRGKRTNHSIVTNSGLNIPEAELPLDPYTLGVWLGDGTAGTGQITSADPEIFDHIPYKSYKLKRKYLYSIDGLPDKLKHLGVICTKFVPETYLMASKEQRLALLQGLMDTDGTCNKTGKAQFYNTNNELAYAVGFLASSLGIKTFHTKKAGKIGCSEYKVCYIVSFTTTIPVFKLKLKLARQKLKIRPTQKQWYIKAVRKVESVPVRCIQVDSPDSTYLTGHSLIPTHNSHLMRVASIVWCTEIAGIQIYLFRRLSDDLFKNHMTGAGSYPELMGNWMESKMVKWNGAKNFLEFWNGSRIFLCHCQYEKDVIKYQGAEIGVLMLDEATHFTPPIYKFLRGRLRLGSVEIPAKYKGLFPRILLGSNPGGVGHGFIKSEFVDRMKPYDIIQMPEEEGGLRRQFIPARLTDNPTLMVNDPHYASRLKGLGDPILVRAMLEGDWNIVAGGALDDVWSDKLIIPRFKIPSNWKVKRSFDWGSSHPFSVGWWAETNGEEVILPDGNSFQPKPKSLIRIFEWYGAKNLHENVGLKLGSVELARGVLEIEKTLISNGWAAGPIYPGPADSQIYNVNDDDTESIGKKMLVEGLEWTRSDKSKGSRVNGLEILRTRMKATVTGEGPAIYFMDNCRAAIATLPILPRDPNNIEDVDTKAIDHVYDDCRYMVLEARKDLVENVNISFNR